MRLVLLVVAFVVVNAAVLFVGCAQKKSEPTPRATPRPFEPLARVTAVDASVEEGDPVFRVVPLPVYGPAGPEGALEVRLEGNKVTAGGAPYEPKAGAQPVLLNFSEETYLAEVAPFFAALDDAKVELWVRHPNEPVAYRLTLKDEAAFQAWLDEPVPGKVRIVSRADGFEVQTNLGHLPGADPNGPTVPLRGGQLDLTTLQKGIERVQARFPSAPDYCLVPSYGVEVAALVRTMAANYVSATSAYFPTTCLVYPRPGARSPPAPMKKP
jgi:hypothetical protein